MEESQPNHPAKIEKSRRRRHYFVRLFWVLVSVGMLGAFVDSVGWHRNSVVLIILGLTVALCLFVDWLAEATDVAIIVKTKGAVTRDEVEEIINRVEKIERRAERVVPTLESLTAQPPCVEVSPPERVQPPPADSDRVSRVYLRVWGFSCSVSMQYVEGLLASRGLKHTPDLPQEGNGQSPSRRQD
jgi:hypothetical protein